MTQEFADDRRVFNAPRVVTWLLGALVLVHVGRLLLAPAADRALVLALGVVPAHYLTADGVVLAGGVVQPLVALVGYTFLHGGWLHLGINGVWLLALGSGVARRLGAGRFLAFYFVCGVLAALAYILIQPGSPVPAVGASGAISGLLGGVIRFVGGAGGGRGLRVSLRDRRLVLLAVLWLGINLLFGRDGLSGLTGGQPIAWEAHLGGFFAGLLLFGLFDRRAEAADGSGATVAPYPED